jgi:hypothetical protein
MSTLIPTSRDIERWVPAHFGHVVGCKNLKDHFFNQLRLNDCGVNTFVSGEPGTGKTATVKAFVQSLMCPNRDSVTLLPCMACHTCRNFDVRFQDIGILAVLNERVLIGGAVPINFYPVNCGAITEAQLRAVLDERREFNDHFFIYLDEAHRLVRRQMEHLLLKPLEELDATWIASSAYPTELGPMFLRRFAAKLTTTLPTPQELTMFPKERCEEWGLTVDADETLGMLARRTRQNPAAAISVLAIAAERLHRLLDRDMVLHHRFDFQDI